MSVERGFIGISLDADLGDEANALFKSFPTAAARSASRAINRVMRRQVVPLGIKTINEQIDFPDGYVKDRLAVKEFATPTKLEGQVAGRGRGTSLVRFLVGGLPLGPRGPRGKGLDVQIKPGQTRNIPGYIVRLNEGNLGFALRLRPGESLKGGQGVLLPSQSGKGPTYLLYGPSVDQAFVDVADEITPVVEAALVKEFYRLMDVEFGQGSINDADD